LDLRSKFTHNQIRRRQTFRMSPKECIFMLHPLQLLQSALLIRFMSNWGSRKTREY